MVGGAGEAEVREDQRRGHHLFNLRCLGWPLVWNCQRDAPGEDTGQLCQPGVPTSVGLQLSVEWWAGAAVGQHQEEELDAGQRAGPPGIAASLTAYNHSSLWTVTAASSLLFPNLIKVLLLADSTQNQKWSGNSGKYSLLF